jgi:hypothetical protein
MRWIVDEKLIGRADVGGDCADFVCRTRACDCGVGCRNFGRGRKVQCKYGRRARVLWKACENAPFGSATHWNMPSLRARKNMGQVSTAEGRPLATYVP